MQMLGYKEWRDHPYALTKGADLGMEPLPLNKNATRHKRVHSFI